MKINPHQVVMLMVLSVLAPGTACRLASLGKEACPPTDVELAIMVGEVRQWVSSSDADFYFDDGELAFGLSVIRVCG